MSRARVALDALLQLGEGTRAGQAQVLGELLRTDRDLLREALADALEYDPELTEATRIATPWPAPSPYVYRIMWVRCDALRPVHYVGRVDFEDDDDGFRGRVFREGGQEVDVGTFNTLEEAQEAVDTELRDGVERWRLQ